MNLPYLTKNRMVSRLNRPFTTSYQIVPRKTLHERNCGMATPPAPPGTPGSLPRRRWRFTRFLGRFTWKSIVAITLISVIFIIASYEFIDYKATTTALPAPKPLHENSKIFARDGTLI